MQIEEYIATKQTILDSIAEPVRSANEFECEFEICVQLAAAAKEAQREAGLSREQLCDGINAYFGRTAKRVEQKQCRKILSLEMLNHHLSKPAEYPMSAPLLFAIQHVCSSLAPAKVLAAAEGGQIASREDVKLIALGRLDQTMADMQSLKRQLKEGP